MPTFVAALFLPYTISFHNQTPCLSPRLTSPRKCLSPVFNSHAVAFSSQIKLPFNISSHGVTNFFPALDQSISQGLSKRDQQQNLSQDVVPIPGDQRKPEVPRQLVRSDSLVFDWGGGQYFNQPKSRAIAPAPEGILEYPKREDAELPDDENIVPASKPFADIRKLKPAGGERHCDSEWTVEPAVQGNGGLVNAVRVATEAQSINDIIWVGTVGFPTEILNEATKVNIYEKLESEYDALTVYVSDSDFDGHYVRCCKSILWPVFHYQMPEHPRNKAYELHSWKYYVNVNQAFADRIVRNYKRGDTIWVHDYHLLLVPGMVRKELPDAQIGFFLHIAFPSSEVFRCLSTRNQLLEGVLGANLVAFQSSEYADHFLTTCSRILGVEVSREGVQLEKQCVKVIAAPIGIDPKGLSAARDDPSVQEWIRVMREQYKNKKIIFARDKLHQIRGVRQKLLAFELFLNKHPTWRDKVVLVQIATSSINNRDLAATVSDIITRFDSQHSTLAHQPLVFLRQDIPFSQYLALLSIADALMITSLREGMNLTCHEYLICQDGKYSSEKHGPVILSEFTGSASIFKGQELSINPWDYRQCAEAIRVALEMSDAEKEARYKEMSEVVVCQNGEAWYRLLQEQLVLAHEESHRRDTMSIPRLSQQQTAQQYQKASRRLFILDYEGTLVPNSVFSKLNASLQLQPPQRVIDTLNGLLSDNRNTVYVVSGRTPEELESIFHAVARLGMVAENGCFLRPAGQGSGWEPAAPLERMSAWKADVRQILTYFSERVNASWVEERHCQLIFHYEGTDDVDAAMRLAGDAANHINDACKEICAIPIDRAVVVEPTEWNRASAAQAILERAAAVGGGTWPDFLMVAGDGREDEVVFRWANGLAQSNAVASVTTVKIGRRSTEAMATLTQGSSGLLSALQRIDKMM